MQNKLAPVVLFVYNRLDHTKQTIEALQRNELASQSDLVIFSDAAKHEKDIEKVELLRCYLESVNGFKNVKLVKRETNFGLAKSIIEGVTDILNKYGKIIVLEDDLITSKYFLSYMNNALDYYESMEKVVSISGFNFSSKFMNFPKKFNDDVFFHYRPMSWGWATWSNRWQDVDWEVSDFSSFIKNRKMRKEFKKGGPDLVRMLKAQVNGQINSWYIRWTYNAFKKNLLTVYPKISYINNIGHDDSGTHCSEDKKNVLSHNELSFVKEIKFLESIQINEVIVGKFNKAFSLNLSKIIRKLKKILFRA